ncbi:MAG: site-specific tyrosine recombinase XerD [Eubacteriales bacterium]|nr:site-specific tyrosine recombinase XerD [Eubacteriales bacterium]
MEQEIQGFIEYLHNTKKTSNNTEVSYERDLKKMTAYFYERGIRDITEVRELDLQGYINEMERKNFASATISRSVASIRALFQYLFKTGRIQDDPSERLKPPKVEKKAPEILSVEEVDKLLKQPSLDTPKGIRDTAMLELLYATGMRVSELIHLRTTDVNLLLGYVTCHENDKERIIPIGSVCVNALSEYMNHARSHFVKDEKETMLFTNCSGKAMSRQGFWKVLKGYADDAGIQGDITPHTLRHSFAVHMLQNGADVRSVQEMLGHADISTTQVYLAMNMKKMRDVYMRAHPRH